MGLNVNLWPTLVVTVCCLACEGCSPGTPPDNVPSVAGQKLVTFRVPARRIFLGYRVELPDGTRQVNLFLFRRDGASLTINLGSSDADGDKKAADAAGRMKGAQSVPSDLLKCGPWVGVKEGGGAAANGRFEDELWWVARPGLQCDLILSWRPPGDAQQKQEAELMAACALRTISAER